jgi:hypothetical protein
VRRSRSGSVESENSALFVVAVRVALPLIQLPFDGLDPLDQSGFAGRVIL